MMGFKFLSVFLVFSCIAFGQQEVIGVPTYRMQSVAPAYKTSDTLLLPFQDDFSGETGFPDQMKWTDSKVYVNNTFPRAQRSRGVATFDGLNEGGRAYDLNHQQSDSLSDVLTSRFLNLTNVSSPYLNFLYQEGGYGEVPESDDSLVVDFWNVDSARWERVWSMKGQEMQNDQWRWASISANDPKWLKNGFRFRLGTYGAQSGGFDVWNVDYLSMESNRTAADTVIEDPAMTIPHANLLQHFTHIPWFHMGSAQFKQNISLGYRRNGPVPTGGWSLYLGKYKLYQDQVKIAQDTIASVITNLDHDVDLNYNVNVRVQNIFTPTASTELKMVSWFDGENVGIRKNDSSVFQVVYDNDYAFDDGSAERVYGLTLGNSYILNRFQPLLSDTLKGLKIFFGESTSDLSNSPFQIVVFKFQNNAPGDTLYLSDSIYYPQFAGGNNQFYSYALDNGGVYINGTCYIGVKQLNNTPLTIGLDLNTDSLTQIVYGDGVNWYPSLQKNSHLMMRPYFKYQPADISVKEGSEIEKPVLRPVPSDGWMYVDLPQWNDAHMEVYDMTGKRCWAGEVSTGQRIDLTTLQSGFYLCRLNKGSDFVTLKFIIQN